MIISASRRTDLPAAHADWLFRRFQEGFALVRNPMNPHQVSRVSLHPDDVDGVVFWTKNPALMLDRLGALDAYPYYFQYTITGFGHKFEPSLPPLGARIDAFRQLSKRIGPERVLWRFDPIALSPDHPLERWPETFSALAQSLRGYTQRATISFVDVYPRNRARLNTVGMHAPAETQMRTLARQLAVIAHENGMEPVACCEPIDFSDCGIAPARCIDAELLSRIGGIPLKPQRDPYQRRGCSCAPSVDLGAYNTCPNGCVYCYANYSAALLRANLAQCSPDAPLLCGQLSESDRVMERKPASLRQSQLMMNL